MNKQNLTTESYKGVRDFYPAEMAIQRFIFESWAKTAESFGFERYDASILESSELYKSKGAENEEMVNEQTYTFIDRGDREVTLRPEMTPTVARMVAGRRRDLSFPLRWYSIPNLFRYERPQRGRLREHWQLNCDIFGADHYTADVELISLAAQVLIDLGATPDMFEIRLNDRKEMTQLYESLGIKDAEIQGRITRLNDRYHKISSADYLSGLEEILGDATLVERVCSAVTTTSGETSAVHNGLTALGITNVVTDRTLARGFSYYTGTIFEIFDTAPENNRSLIGGGRYDNLTGLFGGDTLSAVGFGMGDVTMQDFLTTHHLLPETVRVTAPAILIIPTDEKLNLEAIRIAQQLRLRELAVATDIGTKKIGKKIADAGERGVRYTIVVGSNEIETGTFTLKDLVSSEEETGPLAHLITTLISKF